MTSFHPNGPEIFAANNTIAALEKRWVPRVSGVGRQESYPYISFPLGRFFQRMHEAKAYFAQRDARRSEPRRFLDVGCGIGTKVMLAAQLGWQADGVDFVPEYVDAAQDLLSSKMSQIFLCDAMEFPKYADYDLIFSYRPVRSDDLMYRLVALIAMQAKPGTMLFLPTYDAEGPDIVPFGESLWVRAE